MRIEMLSEITMLVDFIFEDVGDDPDARKFRSLLFHLLIFNHEFNICG